LPGEFSAYDTCNAVRIGTDIPIVDNPRGVRAGEVAAKLYAELILYWKDKSSGKTTAERSIVGWVRRPMRHAVHGGTTIWRAHCHRTDVLTSSNPGFSKVIASVYR
jgi:hypothetical protein